MTPARDLAPFPRLLAEAKAAWGLPSGILLHSIGYGILAGLDVYDAVLILRTRRAVEAFSGAKISLGGELTVTAGTAGARASVETAPVLSYVRGKGLYGGIQIDGNIIVQRQHENSKFYGQKNIQARDILGFSKPNQAATPKITAPQGSLDSLYHALRVAEAGIPDPESPIAGAYLPEATAPGAQFSAAAADRDDDEETGEEPDVVGVSQPFNDDDMAAIQGVAFDEMEKRQG
ncbi:hypothetical protein DL93DRAFT_2195614 [Clavulina sp. PMI_390]|nr:hypothetical protein DL93DRAFT_2195614 [Clavulina sp. PMI_390]